MWGTTLIIRRDGEIEVGRMLPEVGAHCEGQNFDSIGTCLIGKADFMPLQVASLKRLHAALQVMFGGELKVFGHRDFNKHKTCPNFEVKEMLDGVD